MKIKPFATHTEVDVAEKYSEENRAWQGAPSIARTKGGRLFVAFMSGGIYEPDPRNCGLLICSEDGGESWSAPLLSVESKPKEHVRCSDLNLWMDPDGVLWIFWNETPYNEGLAMPTYEQKIDMENDSEYHAREAETRTWIAKCADPDAEELEFTAPRKFLPGIMRNRPFAASSGRWFFPAFITAPHDYYEVHFSDDKGETFRHVRIKGRPDGRHYDEPCFFERKDGSLAVFLRQTGPCYRYMESFDNGESWSAPADLIPAASARPCAHNLRDGSVCFIPSVHEKVRNGLRLLHSEDGYLFETALVLEDRERVSYPEITEDEEGTLYVVYDRERNNKLRKSRILGTSEAAKEILFARIPRAVVRGAAPDENTVRCRVITKARINELENVFTKE